MIGNDSQYPGLVSWGISIAVAALSGLLGVVIGAWLTARRERVQRRQAFVEKQLHDFYSPLLGIRSEIRMRSELRERISNCAGRVWGELCDDARQAGGPEALQELEHKSWPKFEAIIEYNNQQLQEELLPGYRRMLDTFRDNMWLAEQETRRYFAELLEFLEIWDRYLKNALPGELIKALGHSEERLQPFYQHLEKKHDELRAKLKT